MSYQLIQASAHQTGLPDKSVHCVITSPPYYGLRVYSGEQDVDWPEVRYSPMPGLPEIVIPGCDPNCRHEWELQSKSMSGGGAKSSTLLGSRAYQEETHFDTSSGVCIHCGGMRCGLGAEPTPEAFIGHLILVMREMWRVLRDDGVCWVNLGDSYNGSGGAGGDYGKGGLKEGQPKYPGRKIGTLKPKDLMMIPARFALAAQADGWYLRQDCIWHKTAPMPESVTDRCTKADEFIYLLTKQEKYYFDADAIREPCVTASNVRNKSKEKHNSAVLSPIGKGEREWNNPNGRNKRSVWTINPSNYHGAHFATYPLEIPLTCIKAGASAHGVCPKCGAQWERIVESTKYEPEIVQVGERHVDDSRGDKTRKISGREYNKQKTSTTTGWQPTCDCGSADVIPATVLDPFNGSGTTGKAALQLNRSYIGVDIAKEYLDDLTPDRLSNVQIEMAW